MSHHRPVLILLLLFVGLAALYSAATPLGEGPDEPGHAGYVFFLASAGRLPDPRAGEVPGEGHQPPLAYAAALPAALWLPADERALDQPANARFAWGGGGDSNAVAHGSRELWPWRGAALAWHLMRLASVAWGALAVGMTYLAALAGAARLAPSMPPRRFALLAAAVVALNPQFLFICGVVSNDPALAACCAAALWLALRGPGAWPMARYGATLGMVLGLGLLVKLSALVLGPLLALALAAWAWQPGRAGAVRRLLVGAGAFGGAAALAAGWWFVRSWQLYGDPLGVAAFSAEFATQPFDFTSPLAWAMALGQLHSSFWARFGWMNIAPPLWVVWLYGALGLVGLVGWAAQVRRGGLRPWLPPLALIATAAAWLLLFVRTAGLVGWQGRLVFPALPALALVLAAGLARPVWRWPRASAAAGLAALALPAWLALGVIAPAYQWQVLSEPVALARIEREVYGRFGLAGDPGADLRGYALAGQARPGQALELTLYWHSQGRQNRDWTVFVHLVDADDAIVAHVNGMPRQGQFPMGQWDAGDWVEDSHTLALPADLPPGTYHLRVGLYDAKGSQRRAGMWDKKNKLRGDYLTLSDIQVTE